MTTAVLLLHVATTWGMVGLIWFVQLVHYPLLRQVGPQQFPEYEQRHCRQTTWVVAPLMFVELAAAIYLTAAPPAGKPPGVVWLGAALAATLWLSTSLVQAPLHRRLLLGYDDRLAERLVASNWFRTVVWTARGAIALYLVA